MQVLNQVDYFKHADYLKQDYLKEDLCKQSDYYCNYLKQTDYLKPDYFKQANYFRQCTFSGFHNFMFAGNNILIIFDGTKLEIIVALCFFRDDTYYLYL